MLLDPSSRGMSKQTMLDWLRINHPQTPIKSGINKTEVAKIVREMQPEYFPDPNSEAPILDSNAGTSTPSTSSSLTRSTEEKLATPLLPPVLPSQPLEAKADLSKKKRSASDELDCERLLKRPEIVKTDVLLSPSQALKKDKWRQKSAKPHRNQLNGTCISRTIPAKSMSKSISVTIIPQVSSNPADDIPPLIDVSETDWMDSPNPVIGKDIPPMEIPPESTAGEKSHRKSGIEVFKEERKRAQQIQELAESVENLKFQLETNAKSDLSVLAEELRREEEVRLLQVRVADLEPKVEQIGLLQTTVKNLEAEMTRLCGRLSTAMEDIRAQEEVLTKFMNLEEVDENSSANGSAISSELTD